MIAIDASVWIATLLPRDMHHAASRRWLQRWTFAGGLVVVPWLIVPEVAGAVTRRTGRLARGQRAVTDILANPALRFFVLDEDLAKDAASLAAAQTLRGADAVYVALARREGVPLVTWDQEQLARAQAVVATHTPDHAPTAP